MPYPIAAAGLALVGSAVSNMFQQHAQNQAFDQQSNMQRLNYQQSQQAQKNAARNMVEGYKMAGLSPALAAGGNFNAANIPSAPANSAASHPVELAAMFQASKQLELMDSEKQLNEANAHLTDSKAAETDIENARKTNEDDTYNRYLTAKLEEWKKTNPENSKLYDEILQDKGQFTKGAFTALHEAQDFDAFSREVQKRINEADLKAMIAAHQQDGGIWRVLASRPVEEVALLMHERNLKDALAANAIAQSKSEGERLKVLQKEQNRMEAEIKNIDEEARRKRYGKYGNMYEHGDLGAAISEIAGQGAEETAKAVGRESAEVAGDIVRAKTGTPHGIFRSKNESKVTDEHARRRSGTEETWKKNGRTYRRYSEDDDAFPVVGE